MRLTASKQQKTSRTKHDVEMTVAETVITGTVGVVQADVRRRRKLEVALVGMRCTAGAGGAVVFPECVILHAQRRRQSEMRM